MIYCIIDFCLHKESWERINPLTIKSCRLYREHINSLPYHSHRNRCGRKKSKDLKKAEIKVIVICCCYIILGLGASLAYAISSTSLRGLKVELLEYFECERTAGINSLSSQSLCDRSEFESFLNPSSKILGYGLVALYPVITLIYFARKKRKPHHRRTLTRSSASSKSLTLTGL